MPGDELPYTLFNVASQAVKLKGPNRTGKVILHYANHTLQ
jgi:hypothetical protein